jgi:hypothetical protein
MNEEARWVAAYQQTPAMQLAKTGLSSTVVVRSLLPVGADKSESLLRCLNELHHLLFDQQVRTLGGGSDAMDGDTIWAAAQELGERFHARQFVQAALSHSVGPSSS